MTILWTGMILFLGAHALPIHQPLRQSLQLKFGENGYKTLFSLASLAGLILIVWGYGLARQEPVLLYAPPLWFRHLTLLLMLPVFILLAAAYMPGNIKAKLKHPMMIAIKLWAFSHLMANGTLADVLLFGSFLVWAVLGMMSAKRRAVQPVYSLGEDAAKYDIIAVIIGLALYVLTIIWAHEALIGVSPMR